MTEPNHHQLMSHWGYIHRLPLYAASAAVLLAALWPSPAPAIQVESNAGIHVRVAGDITIEDGETSDFVLVINGDALIYGSADVVVVVDGAAHISGGQVGNVIVIDGRVNLTEGAEVSGDVTLVDAEIAREAGTTVGGSIDREAAYWFGFGAAILGVAFAVGFAIMFLLSGLLAAALIPTSMRAAGTVLTDRIGPMLLSAVVVWMGLPVLAAAAMVTIIGIPVGLTIFLLVLPVLGFLGYLVAAVRVGDEILEAVRGRVEPEHPYLATILGVFVLFLLSAVPVLGDIIAPLASLAGGGALALVVWERFRGSTVTGRSDVESAGKGG